VLLSTPGRDRQLVRAAALGDELAWESLVDAHAQLVWGVLQQCGLGRDEAAAASGLVWVRLAQSLTELSGEPVSSWLHRVAVQESENAHARAGRSTAYAAWQRDRRRVARADCG
jgi:DNA-directed RNA polymerase specialized sigma24 family protein